MSRPKDFLTWSAERQEKWREEKRKISRKCYAKNAEKIRRKVRLYKASIRGTVRAEDGFAKKRTRRPEIRKCTGSRCDNTMEYKVWIGRDKVCKSCKAKAIHEEKQAEQHRRRFYKFVAAQGCYGKLDLREVSCHSSIYHNAFDWHRVESVGSVCGSVTFKAYVRSTDNHRNGRPSFHHRYGKFYKLWWDWTLNAWKARCAGEASAALRAYARVLGKIKNLKKQRRASKVREARLKREAEKAEKRKVAAEFVRKASLRLEAEKAEKRKVAAEFVRKASLRLEKKKEKARKAKLEAVRLEGLRRSKLSSEIPFFQMMAGAESIARYVKEQTTNNHEKHDSDSEIR